MCAHVAGQLVTVAGDAETAGAQLVAKSKSMVSEEIERLIRDAGGSAVGRALDASPRAVALTDDLRERASAVTDAVAGADRPRVFYEVSVFQGVIYGAGTDSFLASMIEMAGGEPVVGDATGVIQLEDLVAADPDLILLGDAAYPPPVTPRDVAARPGWKRMRAVKDDRVVPMPDDLIITRPGPRIVDGLEALAHAIHPEAFTD